MLIVITPFDVGCRFAVDLPLHPTRPRGQLSSRPTTLDARNIIRPPRLTASYQTTKDTKYTKVRIEKFSCCSCISWLKKRFVRNGWSLTGIKELFEITV